jgi:arabinosaccharide transport system substrate-binding protein
MQGRLKMSKVKVISFILVVILTLGLVSSPIANAQAAPTELSFWTFVDIHGTYWLAVAERWNKENPTRQVKFTPTNLPYNDMHDKLLLALQSGTGAPDMVDIEIGKFSTFLKGDIHLADLTDMVEPVKKDIVASRLVYQKDGKQYGIDYHVGTYIMYYNKELLSKAGVDVDTIKTWDDYIAAGKKVTKDGVFMTTLEQTGCFPGRALMLMNGGGVYDVKGNLIVDDPKNAEALQFMADMLLTEKIAAIPPGGQHHAEEYYKAMNEGKFASVWMPQWYMTRFTQFMPALKGKVVIRPMPIFKDKPGTFSSSMGGGTGTAITDQIAADKVQLAKDFLRFGKLTTDAGVRIWTELGFDPMITAAYADPALTKPLEYFGNEDVFTQIKSALPNLAPEYIGANYADAMNILTNKTCYDILAGTVKPADALADLKKQVEAMK